MIGKMVLSIHKQANRVLFLFSLTTCLLLMVATTTIAKSRVAETSYIARLSTDRLPAFIVPRRKSKPSKTLFSGGGKRSSDDDVSFVFLFMGKGFNKSQNKQAQLAQKLANAKKQQKQVYTTEEESTAIVTEQKPKLSEEEVKLQNDRAEFAKLLKTSKIPRETKENKAPLLAVEKRSASKKANKSIAKNNKKIKKDKKNSNDETDDINLSFKEGDVARRRDFDKLVSCETSNILGPMGGAALVPWVPPFLSDYLIVVADPRSKSGDLRRTVQYLSANLKHDVLQQVIAINVDPITETTRWLGKSDIAKNEDATSVINFFSDEKLEWMKTYSVIDINNEGHQYWSMSIIIFDNDGCIRKVFRQVDPSQACQLVTDSINCIGSQGT